MPRKMRDSDPVRMGVPTSSPNSVSFSPSSSLMRTPMIEKIVHTAKHTVNESVDIHSARPCGLAVDRSEIPSLRINQVSCRAVPKQKAVDQAPALLRNGLNGGFA